MDVGNAFRVLRVANPGQRDGSKRLFGRAKPNASSREGAQLPGRGVKPTATRCRRFAALLRLYCGSRNAATCIFSAQLERDIAALVSRQAVFAGSLERVTFRLGGAAVVACLAAWPHVLHPAAKKCDRTGVLGLSWVGHPNLIGGQRPAVATLWIAGAYRAILLIFTRV